MSYNISIIPLNLNGMITLSIEVFILYSCQSLNYIQEINEMFRFLNKHITIDLIRVNSSEIILYPANVIMELNVHNIAL